MRRLEASLGQALFLRTTRSVRLTEAGERFLAKVSTPLAEIASAIDAASGSAEEPRGLLRIAPTSIAERFLSGPLIASFSEAYPGVTLDVTVTDLEFDIVAAGFDAGVRLGEVIERDISDGMIPESGDAERLTGLLGRPLHSYRSFAAAIAAA